MCHGKLNLISLSDGRSKICILKLSHLTFYFREYSRLLYSSYAFHNVKKQAFTFYSFLVGTAPGKNTKTKRSTRKL